MNNAVLKAKSSFSLADFFESRLDKSTKILSTAQAKLTAWWSCFFSYICSLCYIKIKSTISAINNIIIICYLFSTLFIINISSIVVPAQVASIN